MSINKLGLAMALMMGASLAQAGSGFMGASIGQATVEDWVSESDLAFEFGTTQNSSDKSDTAFKLYGGLTLNDNVDLRFGYANLGEVRAEATDGFDVFKLNAKVDAVFVDVVGKIKPTPSFALFGKMGVALTRLEVELEDSFNGFQGSDRSSEIEFVPGIGLSYEVNSKFGLVAEYERYLDVGDSDSGETDVDVASIGFYARF